MYTGPTITCWAMSNIHDREYVKLVYHVAWYPVQVKYVTQEWFAAFAPPLKGTEQ